MHRSSSPEGSCPSLEALAAYIDRRLDLEEEARVAEHVASCERCFEIYAGSLEFQAGDEGEGEDAAETAQPLRFQAASAPAARPSSLARQAKRWLPLAAALAVGTVGLLSWRIAHQTPSISDYSSALGDASKLLPFVEGLPAQRGEDSGDGREAQFQSIQAGAILLDFDLLLGLPGSAQGDDALRDLAGDLFSLLESGYFDDRRSMELLEDLRRERGEISQEQRNALHELLRTLAKDDYFSPKHRELGTFAEASRLAARNGQISYFLGKEGPRHLRYLDRLLSGDLELDQDEKADLEKIRSVWPKAPRDSLEPLVDAFDALAGLHGIGTGYAPDLDLDLKPEKGL